MKFFCAGKKKKNHFNQYQQMGGCSLKENRRKFDVDGQIQIPLLQSIKSIVCILFYSTFFFSFLSIIGNYFLSRCKLITKKIAILNPSSQNDDNDGNNDGNDGDDIFFPICRCVVLLINLSCFPLLSFYLSSLFVVAYPFDSIRFDLIWFWILLDFLAIYY